eukprot:jgi/Chrzof1/8364/Cz03g07200.t1
MSKQNTRVEIQEFNAENPLSGVKVVQKRIPEPRADEVLVNVTLRPVNPSDVMCCMGIYPAFAKETPAVPGWDGVGVVVKAGPDATGDFLPGQRVSALGWPAGKGEGSFQEYVSVRPEKLVRIPDGIPDEVAAQFYINPVTVIGLLEVTAVPDDRHLLITAAGSALGRMLIRYAKMQGVKTIGTVRRQEHVDELKALGADEVINTASENLVERVHRITGGAGAWAAVDAVGGDLTLQLSLAVRDNGKIVVYGALAGGEFKGHIISVIFRGLRYEGFWLEPYLANKDDAGRAAVITKIIALMQSGIMVPPVGKTFPLTDFAAAIEESTKEAKGGKVFLKNP